MLARIRQLLSPPVFDSRGPTHRARFLSPILWGFLGVAVAGTVAYASLRAGDPGRYLGLGVGSLLILVNVALISLLRDGRVRLSSGLLLTILFALVTLLNLQVGGGRSPVLSLYLPVLVLGGLLLGGAGAFALAAASMSATLGILLAAGRGWITPQPLPDDSLQWVSYSFAFGLSAVFLFLAARNDQGEISRLAATERSLLENNRDLQAVRATLERQLAERSDSAGVELAAVQALVAAVQEITPDEDLSEALQRAAHRIRTHFESDHVRVYLLESGAQLTDRMDGASLVLAAATDLALEELAPSERRGPLESAGPVSQVLQAGEPRTFTRGGFGPNYREGFVDKSQSRALLPLRTQSRPVGVLDVQRRAAGAFDQRETVLLQALADLLGGAVQGAQPRPGAVAPPQEARSPAAVQEGWSDDYRRDGGRRGYRFSHGRVEPVVESMPAEGQDDGLQETDGAGEITETDVHAVPIRLRDQQIGRLHIRFKRPSTSKEVRTLVDEVANRLALGLENASLLEQIRLRSDQLELLQDITATAAAHVDLGALLSAVVEKLLRGFDALHCGVVLFDEDREAGTLIADASAAPDTPGANILGARLPIAGNPLTQEVIHTRQPLVVHNIQEDPRAEAIHELMALRGTHTLVIIPLISRNEVIGTIGLDIAEPRRRMTGADLTLLDQISRQIASAIDITRLFQQTARRAERERLVTEISTRIRAHNDPQTILETAAQELKAALNAQNARVRVEPIGATTRPAGNGSPVDGDEPDPGERVQAG